jgi:SAM-dependent methyltransferase
LTDGVTNLFVHRSAARRYAAGRPYFHPLVTAQLRAFTGVPRFARGLDVACGTGQSARALAEICEAVEAVDVSAEMIGEAEVHERVTYQVASAERLPFEEGAFNLVTVGLAFHWFDQAAFLQEAARVLKRHGWLAIYTHGFNGEMSERADFPQWAHEVYPKRFPQPPRRAFGVSAELVRPYEFELAGDEKFSNEEGMTAEQLTGYLLTQTNVIAAVETGGVPVDEAAKWILTGVRPFFEGGSRAMKFSGTIWYMKKMGEERR